MPTGCFIFLNKKLIMKINKTSCVHIFKRMKTFYQWVICCRNKIWSKWQCHHTWLTLIIITYSATDIKENKKIFNSRSFSIISFVKLTYIFLWSLKYTTRKKALQFWDILYAGISCFLKLLCYIKRHFFRV